MSTTQAVYPLDVTGKAASNLVTGELQVLSDVNDETYNILIPTFAPFYLHNLKVEHIDQLGVARELNEYIDFNPSLPYAAGTRMTGEFLYGGLSILNTLPKGHFRLQYQTVGDKFCADRDYVYARLLEVVYNRRTALWDTLTNVQELFPPTPHQIPADVIAGHTELLQAMSQLREAILTNPNTVPQSFITHMLDPNPHGVNASTVGLDKVMNYPMATDEECVNRAQVKKYVTLEQIVKYLL